MTNLDPAADLARAWRALALVLALTLVAPLAAADAVADPAPVPPVAPEEPAPTEEPPAAEPAAGDTLAAPFAPPAEPAAVPDTLAAPPAGPAAAAAAPNPALQAVRKVRLSREDRNVARSGPGDAFSIVGVFPRGRDFQVLAKSDDWYSVRLSETETGWFHASLCEEFDDLSNFQFRPNPKLFSRTGSYVLSGYGGGYAFDRKSNSLVLGGRLGYYVFDRLQVEAGVAWTRIHRPAEIVETLFDLSLEAEDFHMLFYAMNVTWELLPGRQMVPFVTAGVGSSIMQGDTEPSFNVGAGTMLYLSKRLGMRWEVRDYHFDSGADNARRSNDNIEFSLGTVYLF
jgi:outer membrane beta-barrel protein